MGAEQSTRRDPPYFSNGNLFEAVLSQDSGLSQSYRRPSGPSVRRSSDEDTYFDPTTGRLRTCKKSQSYRPPSGLSVSDFSNNPEKYPDFVLVLVLSTGKMEVMTRLQARSNAAKVKVVATPNDSGSSDNSNFFRRSSDDDTILYFDPTTGRLRTCKK